jgi:hypothetical protein
MSGTSKVPEISPPKVHRKNPKRIIKVKNLSIQTSNPSNYPILSSKNLCVSDEKQCSRRRQTAGPSVSELRIVAPGRPKLIMNDE